MNPFDYLRRIASPITDRFRRGLSADSSKASMADYLEETAGAKVWPGISIGPKVRQTIQEERVKSGPSGINMPWFLPYHDNQTDETPAMRREYRRMLRDPNIKAALFGKIFGVASLGLKVHPDGEGPLAKRVAGFVEWNLTRRVRGGVPRLVTSVGAGMLIDGYSIAEKVFKPELDHPDWKGKWPLRALKAKDVDNDVVLVTDEYRNIVGVQALRYNAGEVYSPALFAIGTHLPLYENPTGMSDLRAAYSRYWLLDTVLKLRAIAIEKRAIPLLVGTYLNTQQKPSLESALATARAASWFSVPEGVRVEAIEVAGQSQDMFANFIKDLKHDIFLGITYAILQALEGNVTGSRSIGEVHQDTSQLPVWYLSVLIQEVLNSQDSGVVPDLTYLNFAGASPPLVTLEAVDPEEEKRRLESDERLSRLGLPLSKSKLYETYNREPPISPDDRLVSPTSFFGPMGAGTQTSDGDGGQGVPAATPFRFSERWRHYVEQANGGANTNRRLRQTTGPRRKTPA